MSKKILLQKFETNIILGWVLYVSQLYVMGMASLHLIYHPVDAEKWAK